MQRLLYAVVQLRHVTATRAAFGTGFFFRLDRGDGRTSIVLVTNMHVARALEGQVELTLHGRAAPDAPPNGRLAILRLAGSPGDGWVPHPAGLDLCAFPFEARVGTAMRGLFIEAVDEAMLLDDATAATLDVLEPVVLVGCPSGEEDHANAYPLFIRGATASDPAVDYNGHDEVALSLVAGGGASGSPVFLAPGTSTEMPSLLGVLYGEFAPRVPGAGLVAGQTQPVDVRLPSGIGFCIKARALRPLAEEMLRVLDGR
jgi:hypothetical protein